LLLLCLNTLGYQERVRHAADPSLRRASRALTRALKTCTLAHEAVNRGDIADGYATLFRALQQYVGDRCNVASDGLTKDELQLTLQTHHAPTSVMTHVAAVAEACDVARFASGTADAADCQRAINDVLKLINAIRENEHIHEYLRKVYIVDGDKKDSMRNAFWSTTSDIPQQLIKELTVLYIPEEVEKFLKEHEELKNRVDEIDDELNNLNH